MRHTTPSNPICVFHQPFRLFNANFDLFILLNKDVFDFQSFSKKALLVDVGFVYKDYMGDPYIHLLMDTLIHLNPQLMMT